MSVRLVSDNPDPQPEIAWLKGHVQELIGYIVRIQDEAEQYASSAFRSGLLIGGLVGILLGGLLLATVAYSIVYLGGGR